MVTLFKEDFTSFKIGDFPYDPEHSAMGEYHYAPPEGYRGAWYSPIADYGYKGPSWMIVLNDGKKAIESQVISRSFPTAWNMLTAGDEDWEDYTFSCSLEMLNIKNLHGIGFRYQNSRVMYCLCFEEQKLKALKKQHETTEVLASLEYAFESGKPYELKVECNKDKFVCYVNNQHIFGFTDDDFKSGRICLISNSPAQFTDIEVTASETAYAGLSALKEKKQSELIETSNNYSMPKLYKKIDLKDFGCGRNIRFGDLTGNGELNIVLAQAQKRVLKDRYANISCLTAIDLDGNILWQIGEPNPEHAFITADLPFQIADVDLDGKNEVVVAKDFKIMILDGATGKVKKSVDTPFSTEPVESLYSGVPYGMYAFEYVNIDCIRICNFTGKEKPTDIMVKDRYSRVYAYDNELNFLWKFHDGITGHFPYTQDINGDGREEMVVGYNLVGADGKKIWTLPVKTDHTDEIIIGDFSGQGEQRIALVSGDEGFILSDFDGNILVKDMIGHAQRISAGNYRPDREGYEIAVTTYWGHQGIIYIYTGSGELLYSFEPGTNGNIISPVNWTGNGDALILLNGKGGMIDGYGRKAVAFPDYAANMMCAEAIDITGDERDEIVLWDNRVMYIFTQEENQKGEKKFRPEKYPLYNASNYRGEYLWLHAIQ